MLEEDAEVQERSTQLCRKDLSIPSPVGDGRSPAMASHGTGTPDMTMPPKITTRAINPSPKKEGLDFSPGSSLGKMPSPLNRRIVKGKGKAKRVHPEVGPTLNGGEAKTGRKICQATIVSWAVKQPVVQSSPPAHEVPGTAPVLSSSMQPDAPEAAPLPEEATHAAQDNEPALCSLADSMAAASLEPEALDAAVGETSPLEKSGDEALPSFDLAMTQHASDASPTSGSPVSGVSDFYPELNNGSHTLEQADVLGCYLSSLVEHMLGMPN